MRRFQAYPCMYYTVAWRMPNGRPTAREGAPLPPWSRKPVCQVLYSYSGKHSAVSRCSMNQRPHTSWPCVCSVASVCSARVVEMLMRMRVQTEVVALGHAAMANLEPHQHGRRGMPRAMPLTLSGPTVPHGHIATGGPRGSHVLVCIQRQLEEASQSGTWYRTTGSRCLTHVHDARCAVLSLCRIYDRYRLALSRRTFPPLQHNNHSSATSLLYLLTVRVPPPAHALIP